MRTYGKDTPTDTPVEVRIRFRDQSAFVLVAWEARNGTVDYSLTDGRGGIPNSLSNLQSKETFPGKAVRGWQAEVVRFAEAGLGEVVEVR